MNTPSVSFLIPTLNEGGQIREVLLSIRQYAPSGHEVIVIDNGSTDKTCDLARDAGAQIHVCKGVTIAALRNHGVRNSRGRLLVFLDGDVLLTADWGVRFVQVMDALEANPLIVTGSRCGVGSHPSWIEKYWFEPLTQQEAGYINSGHLITTRELFEKIGGFDANCRTGEDTDFSRRARAAGALIINDRALRVVHEGYPKTLLAFIRREIWHGSGGFRSGLSILQSKTALLSLGFLALHIAFFVLLLIPRTKIWTPVVGLVILALCIASVAMKFRKQSINWAAAGCIFYFYYWGRSLSFLNAVLLGNKLLR